MTCSNSFWSILIFICWCLVFRAQLPEDAPQQRSGVFDRLRQAHHFWRPDGGGVNAFRLGWAQRLTQTYSIKSVKRAIFAVNQSASRHDVADIAKITAQVGLEPAVVHEAI